MMKYIAGFSGALSWLGGLGLIIWGMSIASTSADAPSVMVAAAAACAGVLSFGLGAVAMGVGRLIELAEKAQKS